MSKERVCVGAFDRTKAKNIRLLPQGQYNWPDSAPFKVGHRYKLKYRNKTKISPPHLEDVEVVSYEVAGELDIVELGALIRSACPIQSCPLTETFEHSLDTAFGSLSIAENRIPSGSVGFWLSDRPLYRHDMYGKVRFRYGDELKFHTVPFVGVQPRIDVIPEGTLVRLSLTRSWKPYGSDVAEKSYLQISGWYL